MSEGKEIISIMKKKQRGDVQSIIVKELLDNNWSFVLVRITNTDPQLQSKILSTG